MRSLGCSRAREYYEVVRLEWQQGHEQQMKNVAAWYVKQNFDRREVRESRKDLRQMSNSELLTHLENLIAEA